MAWMSKYTPPFIVDLIDYSNWMGNNHETKQDLVHCYIYDDALYHLWSANTIDYKMAIQCCNQPWNRRTL